MKSTFHGETHLAIAPLVVDEITLVGSRCGPFAAALDLLATGQVDVRPLVDAVYPLDRYADAFAAAEAGAEGVLRPCARCRAPGRSGAPAKRYPERR